MALSRGSVSARLSTTTETPSCAPCLADPAHHARMLGRIPMGRFGTADEMAAVVRYLAVPQGPYISRRPDLTVG
jgi:NAD(P)-dependent dehydrogenase (short-subunit alcohol dehydrogenase family)